MTREQMIAWLTIEGWIPYPRMETQGLSAGAAREGKGLVHYPDSGNVTSHSNVPWDDPTTWDAMSDAEVEGFYNYLTGDQK